MPFVRTLSTLAVAVLVVLSTGRIGLAQSSLFSIPTTDVVESHATYAEFDFVSHLETHRDGGFQLYGAKSVYGLGHDVEVGANVTFVDAEEPNQPVEIQPNAKWKFFEDEKAGVSAAAGGVLFAPAANRDGVSPLGFVYSCVSKSVRPAGARFTAGAYTLVGPTEGGARRGGLFGYEQGITKRVTFVADWVTGNNRFGYVTPGFAVGVTRKSALSVGYNVGNEGRKNNAFYFTYGYFF